jgi:hypothetical protein
LYGAQLLLHAKQTAAVLSRRVPKISGGADVLQLSADGCKALYYFPDDGVRRVILSTTSDIKQVSDIVLLPVLFLLDYTL